ncbi:MAG: site-specific integrase [Bacteroidetes bacterium]|nr:site-specific integrase [Bacteroidota bacterium]MBU1719828.1 site-specific integrase [Bacteroidota bacterium]
MTTRSMLKMMFFIRRQKPLRDGRFPIFLRINILGKSADATIGLGVSEEMWSPENGCATGKTNEVRRINETIDRTKAAIIEHYRKMIDEGTLITATGLRNAWLGKSPDEKTLLGIFKEHNERATQLIGKEFAKGTVKRYRVTYNHITNYLNSIQSGKDIPLSQINHEFITGFEFYLKSGRNLDQNTVIANFKILKKVIRIANANGWIKTDPFVSFKLTPKKVDKGYLTEEEISRMQNYHFKIERLEQVRDVFLFGCFTGLSYTDLKDLRPDNVIVGNDGKLWIHSNRAKTGSSCHIPLLPPAQTIIEKYKSSPHCQIKHVLLPVYSNQKQNAYLKEIADVCGIEKNLSTHLARHTFATTVTLNNDVPIETVSKMLGHSSIKMTQIYARLLDKKVGQDMSKLYAKY